jgi:hypothetical protein
MIKQAIATSMAAEKFHEDLINLYTSAVQSCNCQPISISSVVAQGGVPAAKKYLANSTVRSGLFPLSEYGRIDLSVESLVLRAEYRGLFEPIEIQEAEKRLNFLKSLVSQRWTR